MNDLVSLVRFKIFVAWWLRVDWWVDSILVLVLFIWKVCSLLDSSACALKCVAEMSSCLQTMSCAHSLFPAHLCRQSFELRLLMKLLLFAIIFDPPPPLLFWILPSGHYDSFPPAPAGWNVVCNGKHPGCSPKSESMPVSVFSRRTGSPPIVSER